MLIDELTEAAKALTGAENGLNRGTPPIVVGKRCDDRPVGDGGGVQLVRSQASAASSIEPARGPD